MFISSAITNSSGCRRSVGEISCRSISVSTLPIAIASLRNSSSGSAPLARSATSHKAVSQVLIAANNRRACCTSENNLFGLSEVLLTLLGGSDFSSGRTSISILSPTFSPTASHLQCSVLGSSEVSIEFSQTRLVGSSDSTPWLRLTCAPNQPLATREARAIGRSFTVSERRMSRIVKVGCSRHTSCKVWFSVTSPPRTESRTELTQIPFHGNIHCLCATPTAKSAPIESVQK